MQGATRAPREADSSFTILVQGDEGRIVGGNGGGAAAAEAVEEVGSSRVQQEERTRTVYTNVLYLFILDLVVTSGFLVWQQIGFAPTWSNACDYSLKIWATVWLSKAFLRSALSTAIQSYQVCTGRRAWKGLSILKFVLDIFSFVWYFYGIYPLFLSKQKDRWCNTVSTVWALVGWSLQTLTFFFPCILFICCVPCFLCITRFEWFRRRILPYIIGPIEPNTNQTPTPDDVLAKLHSRSFRDAVHSDAIDLEQPATPAAEPTGDQSAVTRSLLNGGPFGFGTAAMSNIITRLNSAAAETNSGAAANDSNSLLTCPICVTEFVGDDEILQLPCDPRRHVFHASCVREWLKKSQHCPMCRTNLVDFFRQPPPPPPPSPTQEDNAAPSHQPNTT